MFVLVEVVGRSLEVSCYDFLVGFVGGEVFLGVILYYYVVLDALVFGLLSGGFVYKGFGLGLIFLLVCREVLL